MAYPDPKFNVRVLTPVVANGTIANGGSGASTDTAAFVMPKFIRRSAVTAVRCTVKTAPVAGLTAMTLNFKNGTSTFAVATLSGTAGQTFDGTVTASNATFTANAQPTVSYVGTATDTGLAPGVFDVWFEVGELYG